MNSKKDAHWDETVDHPWIGKIEKSGRSFLYWLASFAVQSNRSEASAKGFSLEKLKSILIIKEPYRMGDLIQITPTLRTLKQKFPSLYVGLVIQDRNKPIFQYNPYIDQLFLYKKREFNHNPWKLFAFFQEIRKRKFDCAVTLETQRTHLTNDLIAFFSGAPIRVRYDGETFGNEESNVFYNSLSEFDSQTIHEVDRNFGVFKAARLKLDDPKLFLKVSESELNSARKVLESIFTTCHLPLTTHPIIIHPGAYKINNRWPLTNYIEIGKRLQNQGKAVIFILGPSETEWRTEIEKQNFPVISGISILEMAGIFSLSETVLCNDTGVMHISAAVGSKTVALFGETNPLQWKPPGDYVKVVQSPDGKIASIYIEQVIKALT